MTAIAESRDRAPTPILQRAMSVRELQRFGAVELPRMTNQTVPPTLRRSKANRYHEDEPKVLSQLLFSAYHIGRPDGNKRASQMCPFASPSSMPPPAVPSKS